MAAPIWNHAWSLKRLLMNTYAHSEIRNRFDNMKRDVLRGIRVEKRTVHDGISPSKTWTVYRIISFSYPQYSPYTSSTNRLTGSKQRRYKHQYEVVLSLQTLSMNSPVRLRTGANRKWDFSPAGRSRKLPNGIVREGTNVRNGINGDFFMRLEFLYAQAGILFGRCYANGPPIHTNPHRILFLDKHALRVVRTLMERGILVRD